MIIHQGNIWEMRPAFEAIFLEEALRRGVVSKDERDERIEIQALELGDDIG